MQVKIQLVFLESYNPRHVVKDYPEQIMAIMEKIENTKITKRNCYEITP